LIPCHQVRLYAHDRLQLAHPSPLSEQFRARCIDQGFDDCPNMDYGFFTEI
jgi:hypothetical protein